VADIFVATHSSRVDRILPHVPRFSLFNRSQTHAWRTLNGQFRMFVCTTCGNMFSRVVRRARRWGVVRQSWSFLQWSGHLRWPPGAVRSPRAYRVAPVAVCDVLKFGVRTHQTERSLMFLGFVIWLCVNGMRGRALNEQLLSFTCTACGDLFSRVVRQAWRCGVLRQS